MNLAMIDIVLSKMGLICFLRNITAALNIYGRNIFFNSAFLYFVKAWPFKQDTQLKGPKNIWIYCDPTLLYLRQLRVIILLAKQECPLWIAKREKGDGRWRNLVETVFLLISLNWSALLTRIDLQWIINRESAALILFFSVFMSFLIFFLYFFSSFFLSYSLTFFLSFFLSFAFFRFHSLFVFFLFFPIPFSLLSFHLLSFHLLSFHLLSFHLLSFHLLSFHLLSFTIYFFNLLSFHFFPSFILSF